jgi:hypothetical protein
VLVFYRIHDKQISPSVDAAAMNAAWHHQMVASGDFQTRLRVGVLTVCTGRYCEHLERHLRLLLSNFLAGHGKTCYIFTDQVARARATVAELARTHDFAAVVTAIEGRGFPGDTLYRYHYMLLQEQHILAHTDVVYYMDVDLVPEANIRAFEVVPSADRPLVAVRHMLQDGRGTPEARPQSRAYLADAAWRLCYFAGGFLGGRSPDFMRMARTIAEAVDDDDSREVVAIWHDESHLNKYLAVHHARVRVLPPSYLYPQGWDIPYRSRIAVQKIPHDATRYAQDRFVAPCGGAAGEGACSLGPGLGATLFQVAAAIALACALNEEEGERERDEAKQGFQVLLPLTWCFGDSTHICAGNEAGNAGLSRGGVARVSYRGSWLHRFRRHDKFAHLDVTSVGVSALAGLGAAGLSGYTGPRRPGLDAASANAGAGAGGGGEPGTARADDERRDAPGGRGRGGKGGALVVVGSEESALAFHPRYQAEVRELLRLPEGRQAAVLQRYQGSVSAPCCVPSPLVPVRSLHACVTIGHGS